MGKYNGAIVTTVGQNLIANAVASNQKVIFTKLKASTHVYASTTDFEAMTSISDIVQSVDISYAGVYNNNVIQVSGRFTNDGVATAFTINTIGLYGKVGSGSETLVAIVTAVNADTMPVADPVSPTAIVYNIQMTVQNSGVMEVEVNDAGTINVHQFNDALYSTALITVPTTGWTASGSQYTKTIDVGGITSTSMPFVELQYPSNVTASQKKAIDKAASKLVSLTTTNYGQVLLTATAVPETSFDLLLRGLGSGQYTQPYNEFFTTVLDKEPYVSRTARDGLVKPTLVGATVAWNQLVNTGTEAVTIPTGRKYILYHDGTYTLGTSDGTAVAVSSGDMFFDITLMFGTTVANAMTTALFASLFPKTNYVYDAGSLQSVCTSGRKITALDGSTRTYPIDNEELRGLFKLDANNKLYADGDLYPSSGSGTRKYGIVDLGDLTYTKYDTQQGTLFRSSSITNSNLDYQHYNIICSKYPTAYTSDRTDKTISVNELNKVDIIDNSYSDAATFKTAMDGVYLVYELATPTTLSADPYLSPQRSCDGTEEFVDGLTRDVMIPVGNESTYYLSEVLPSAAEYTDARADDLALLKNYTRRTQRDITNDLAYLSKAVAEQNLEKYGYSIGDYFTGASGYTYFLADMDTFYGGYDNNAVVNTHHVGIVVNTDESSKWNATNDTTTGYVGSVLHTYLSGTVLDNIKADMIALFGGTTGLEHLVAHSKIYTSDLSSWIWTNNQYISALTEVQLYGSNVWSVNGYQTGEACKQLEIFRKFRFNQIIKNFWFWLRSINSASKACYSAYDGISHIRDAAANQGVVGLILFK